MLIPIVCFGCGGSLGDKAELYLAARQALVKAQLEATDTAPEMAAVRQDIHTDCQELFAALCLLRDCCRMHIATAMVMSHYY